jgi:hypothetical protein
MWFPEVKKQIEQVGSGYETLKKKYARLHERMEKGASANFTDSEPEESEEEVKETVRPRLTSFEETENKRHKKTKDDIEREALEQGDLYGVLGLEALTFDAVEADINRAYKKAALKFHPDKLLDKITEVDKEMWL